MFELFINNNNSQAKSCTVGTFDAPVNRIDESTSALNNAHTYFS